jgi:hypothetical protein
MKNLTLGSQPAAISAPMRITMAILLLACGAAAQGQPPAAPRTARPPRATLNNVQSVEPYYRPRPAYYPPGPAPGWNSARRASTAAEGFARGHAAAVAAHGHYNLMTAQARVVHAEAASREIENREQWIDSYFAMRAKNRQERAAERGPHPTVEQLQRIAATGRPAPLSPSEVDTATGAIAWPILLQEDDYRTFRSDVEGVFAQRAATGALSPDAVGKAKQATEAMLAELKSRVWDVSQQDYIAARRFIESLAYEVRSPAS